jgi:hypothetical protein
MAASSARLESVPAAGVKWLGYIIGIGRAKLWRRK